MRFEVRLWHDRRMDPDSSYEDRFGPALRRALRVGRAARWGLQSISGRPRTILVETRWRLGDEIMALPILDALGAAYPKDMLFVLANYPDLFEGRGYIAGINAIPERVDWYILLRGSDRREYRGAVYARKAGLPVPDAPPRLLYQNWSAPLLESSPLSAGPLIAVAPETTWRTKRWPRERWETLCRALRARGARVAELGEHGLGLPVNLALAGRTTVREAACVLHYAQALVSCDNGLMHLALAAGTPTVALFGPTDPDILIRDHPGFVPLRSALECHGYWNRMAETPDPERCPLNHDCCLTSITVEEVLGALARRIGLAEW